MAGEVNTALLERLKEYMLINHDDEDKRIRRLYLRAVDYLSAFDVLAPDEQEDTRFEQAAFALTLHWHDQLGGVTDAKANELPLGLRDVINRLKVDRDLGRVSNLDTEVTP